MRKPAAPRRRASSRFVAPLLGAFLFGVLVGQRRARPAVVSERRDSRRNRTARAPLSPALKVSTCSSLSPSPSRRVPSQPSPAGGRKATLASSSSSPAVVTAPSTAHTLTATIRTLSPSSPRAFLWPGALSAAEADALIAVATPKLAPSTLALRPGETAEEKAGIRTSDGTFMSPTDDPSGVLARASALAATLTGIPSTHQEAFNLLRYRPGARYEAHYDSFAPDGYGPQASARVATVLFYLSDVEAGGETVFPLAGPAGAARLASGAPIDYRACEGLAVKPRKGDALLFYSAHPNGTADAQALHGGCPVVRGEKWVATLWVRDQVV